MKYSYKDVNKMNVMVRRLCMMITSIPSRINCSAEDVRNSVESIIEDSGCVILAIAFNRAHRIGKNDPSGKKCKASYCNIH